MPFAVPSHAGLILADILAHGMLTNMTQRFEKHLCIGLALSFSSDIAMTTCLG